LVVVHFVIPLGAHRQEASKENDMGSMACMKSSAPDQQRNKPVIYASDWLLQPIADHSKNAVSGCTFKTMIALNRTVILAIANTAQDATALRQSSTRPVPS
jgi:hypothetical protein